MSDTQGLDDLHPVEYLFERLREVAPYPPGVVPVPGWIRGTAFFPGGTGLWQTGPELPPMPVGGVMILGHNFDTLAGFQRSLTHAGENLRGETWRNLLHLLDKVDIPRQRCFFTNAYMGLIDVPSALGRFPGAQDAAFVARCIWFLSEQIRVMRPRLICTLGKEVIPILAQLTPNLTFWRDIHGLPEMDAANASLVCPVGFTGVPYPLGVTALTHPAMRHLNIGRRRHRDLRGDDAEVTMLVDALAMTRAHEKEVSHVPTQA
jgi:uracil-DNA glycosylase